MFDPKPYRFEVPVTSEGYVTHLMLTRPCHECKGTGVQYEHHGPGLDEPLSCQHCYGIGGVPTAAGSAVLNFVARFQSVHTAVLP